MRHRLRRLYTHHADHSPSPPTPHKTTTPCSLVTLFVQIRYSTLIHFQVMWPFNPPGASPIALTETPSRRITKLVLVPAWRQLRQGYRRKTRHRSVFLVAPVGCSHRPSSAHFFAKRSLVNPCCALQKCISGLVRWLSAYLSRPRLDEHSHLAARLPMSRYLGLGEPSNRTRIRREIAISLLLVCS